MSVGVSVYVDGSVCVCPWECLCMTVEVSVYNGGSVCVCRWECLCSSVGVSVYVGGSVPAVSLAIRPYAVFPYVGVPGFD